MSSFLTCQFSALANCQLYSSAHCRAALFKFIVKTKMVSENQTEMNHFSSVLQPVKKYCMHKYVNHIFLCLYDCSDHFLGHTRNQIQRLGAANCTAEIAKRESIFFLCLVSWCLNGRVPLNIHTHNPCPLCVLSLSLHTLTPT